MHFKKSEWFVIGFNLIYLLILGAYHVFVKNYEFLIYIAVLLIFGVIIISTLKVSRLDLLALWLLSIWGFLHLFAGSPFLPDGKTIYSLRLLPIFDGGGQFYILKMDQLIHFYGFFVAALVVYELLATRVKNNVSKGLLIFIAWIGGMGLGALNEVIEFIAFISLQHTGVGDVYNTGLDLIFNLLGALVGAFFASWWMGRKRL